MAILERGQLRDWAVKGADQRLLEIANEAAAIHRAFPELRRRGNGLPAASAGQSATASTAIGRPARGRRRMSADARRRISEAQKARWAKQRGDGQTQAAPEAPKGGTVKRTGRGGARKMSAAARKRIGDAQRKRWAEVKAKQGKTAGGDISTAAASSRKKR
jgi:hypothetical protein